MDNKSLVSELKKRTMSDKSKIKNLKYKLKILKGEINPQDCYGCKYLSYLNTLSDFDRMYIENMQILSDIFKIEDRVKMVGKVILLIRGNKWSI